MIRLCARPYYPSDTSATTSTENCPFYQVLKINKIRL